MQTAEKVQTEHEASAKDQVFSRKAGEVQESFSVDKEHGLSSEEVQERRRSDGPNVLADAKRRGWFSILIAQCKSIVIILLAAAALLALVTGRYPEFIALLCVILVNALIGFVSEYKAVSSMQALRALGATRTRARRNGEECTVLAEELVCGDIVLFGAEDPITADVRLLDAQNLRVNEAALTGESVPADKFPGVLESDTPLAERRNMLYKGTSVAEGKATGLVVATGMRTELGRISQLAAEAEGQSAPLQKKLDDLGRKLAWITIAVAVVVAVVGLLAGRETILMIETALAMGVAAIPEGLPIVATIALARGMYIMAQRNALVNRLAAVETLGSTGIIFTDKTGTLTENKMLARCIYVDEGHYELPVEEEVDEALSGQNRVQRVIRIGVLCNNAQLNDAGERASGDPTEVALLKAGLQFGFTRQDLIETYPELREVSFDPEVMMMATYHQVEDKVCVCVKGAPQAVLEKCTHYVSEDTEQEMDDANRQRWAKIADDLAGEGLRLLAMADKSVPNSEGDPYENLRFVGLLGLVDPPRREVRSAIEACQAAGIRAIMVTGDRPDTGRAIGEQVGLKHDGGAIHGSEISDANISEEERLRLLSASVFARVTPEQKLRLVKLYQDNGEVVAMTGDGVNDAPALKQADIGVAMGERGTDAAKQVADMVLLDDKFSTIVAAIEHGRIIFGNIRKAVIFMLCTNLAEILVVTIASVLNAPLPLKPLQILYLNVLTDVFPALALGVGVGSKNVMNHRPRNSEEAVLTKHHWTAITLWSLTIGSMVLLSLALALNYLGYNETQAVTVSFLTLAFCKLWFVLNLRDSGSSIWQNDIVKNPWMWAALGFCIVLLFAAVYLSPLASVLQTIPPDRAGWLLILCLSAFPTLLGVFVPGINFYADPKR